MAISLIYLGGPMKIHHICIQTSDYATSLRFYTQVLGFSLLQESEGFHGRAFNTWLDLEGFMIELQTAKAGEVFSPYNKNGEGMPHFCLVSNQFEEDYRKIKASDLARFRHKDGMDIYTVGNGQLFKLVAPEGTIIEIRNQQVLS